MRGFVHFVLLLLFIFLVLGLASASPVWADNVDDILRQAHEALAPGPSMAHQAAISKSAPHFTHSRQLPSESSSVQKDLNELNKLTEELDRTAPPSGPQAHEALAVDLKALEEEREPQDPRFTVLFTGGQYLAFPSYTLNKDDDTFRLAGTEQLMGGALALETSWRVSFLRLLLQGSIGLFYTGNAQILRQGIQNGVENGDIYVAPFSLAAGASYTWRGRWTLRGLLGPAIILTSQRGAAQTDTLSGAVSSDVIDLGLGCFIGDGWDVRLDYFKQGILNSAFQGEGLVAGIGYRISG